MPIIVVRKIVTMKMILIVEVTFSLKALPLRGKGLLLVLNMPFMEVFTTVLHSFLLFFGFLMFLSLLMLLRILLLSSLLLLLSFSNNFLSFVVVGIFNYPYMGG